MSSIAEGFGMESLEYRARVRLHVMKKVVVSLRYIDDDDI